MAICRFSWHRFFSLAVFFMFQPVTAQSFQIEDWEIRLNKRQPPVQILDAIGVKPGMTIGEVGAGTGRMTLWLAERVGKDGSIYANDIDKDGLNHLKERSKRDVSTVTWCPRTTNPRANRSA